MLAAPSSSGPTTASVSCGSRRKVVHRFPRPAWTRLSARTRTGFLCSCRTAISSSTSRGQSSTSNRAVYLASLDDSQAQEATPRDRRLRRRCKRSVERPSIIFCIRRTTHSGPSRSIPHAGSCLATRSPFLKTWACSPCPRPARWSRDRPRPNRRSSPGSIVEERLSARSGPWAITGESNCLRTTHASRPLFIGRSAVISRSG